MDLGQTIGIERCYVKDSFAPTMSFISLCAILGRNGTNGLPNMEPKEVREHGGFFMFRNGDSILLTRASEFARDYLRRKGCNFTTGAQVVTIDHVYVTKYINDVVSNLANRGNSYEQIVHFLINDHQLRIIGALNGDQILTQLTPSSVDGALQYLADYSEYYNNEKYKETFKKNVLPSVDFYMNNEANKTKPFIN